MVNNVVAAGPSFSTGADLYSNLLQSCPNRSIAGLRKMAELILLKNYSINTLNAYCEQVVIFAQYFEASDISLLRTDHVRDYFLSLLASKSICNKVYLIRYSAVKFFYVQCLGQTEFFSDIPRAKREVSIPKVLSDIDLFCIITNTANLKHKAMIMLAYGAGLRVSEVSSLKISDIDSKQMRILVRCSKNLKDRYVPLCPILLECLRNYFRSLKIKPLVYLFEGEFAGNPYPVRSIQKVFHNAKLAAGIESECTFHSLRHGFATDCLKNGVDLYSISSMLGHKSLAATSVYLHLDCKNLERKSPLYNKIL